MVAAAASACPPNSLSWTLASPKRMGHCEAALQADALVHQQLPEERGGAAWGPSGGARRRGALHGGVEAGPGNQGLFRRSGAEPRTEQRARPRPLLCVSHRGLWGKLRQRARHRAFLDGERPRCSEAPAPRSLHDPMALTIPRPCVWTISRARLCLPDKHPPVGPSASAAPDVPTPPAEGPHGPGNRICAVSRSHRV